MKLLNHTVLFIPLIFLLLLQDLSAADWRKYTLGETIINVEVVTSAYDQQMGLGNRDSLSPGTGMLFLYGQARERVMWMKRMRFSIDIAWIRGGKVIHLEKEIPPPLTMTRDARLKRYGVGVTADQVLELPSGYLDQLGVSIGDQARLTRR